MAEFVVPLRKKIKNSLTRQGMHDIRGLHRKRLTEKGKKEQVLLSVRVYVNFFLFSRKQGHSLVFSFLRESWQSWQSWQWKRTCTSFWTAAQEHLSQWPLLRHQGKPCLRELRQKFTSGASTRQTSTIKLGRGLKRAICSFVFLLHIDFCCI